MKNTIDRLVKSSNSLEILKKINNNMSRSFHTHTHILYDLRTILGHETIKYLEIGSYIGSSACLLLSHPFPSHIICIDPLNLDPSHYNGQSPQRDVLERNLSQHKKDDDKVTILANFSTDPKLLETLKFLEVDILFIDGDHSFQGVIQDFQNYRHMVKKGGFIVFDDYRDSIYSPEVKVAVDHIVKNMDICEFEIIGSIENFQNAHILHEFPSHSNEFILYKRP